MNMLSIIRRIGTASAVGVTALLGFSTVSAGAGTALHLGTIHAIAFGARPTSDLVGNGSTVRYSPDKLTHLSAVPAADCSSSDFSFTIDNKTSTAQTITDIGGGDVGTIPAGDSHWVCLVDSGTTFKLGLRSSPAAELKAKTS
jgi:hypothetical protein